MNHHVTFLQVVSISYYYHLLYLCSQLALIFLSFFRECLKLVVNRVEIKVQVMARRLMLTRGPLLLLPPNPNGGQDV